MLTVGATRPDELGSQPIVSGRQIGRSVFRVIQAQSAGDHLEFGQSLNVVSLKSRLPKSQPDNVIQSNDSQVKITDQQPHQNSTEKCHKSSKDQQTDFPDDYKESIDQHLSNNSKNHF